MWVQATPGEAMRLKLLLPLSTVVLAAGCGGRTSLWIGDGQPVVAPPDARTPRRETSPRIDVRRGDLRRWVDAAPWRGKCTGTCSSAAQCGPVMKYCTGGTCTMCKTDFDCDMAIYKGGCNTATGFCRMCKVDADCPAFKGGCNTATGVCGMCKADVDCTISGAKIMTGKCDALGMCTRCTSVADCQFAASPYKACTAGRCVLCATDAHCAGTAGSAQHCDVASGACTACTSAAECKAAFGPNSFLTWTCSP